MTEKLKIKYVKSKSPDNQKYIGAILNDRMIGHLCYKFRNGQAWLYFVGVNRDYRRNKEEQVGSTLMRIFENDCFDNKIWGLEGKFWPKGEKGDVVRKFYYRNGYKIDRDGYDLLVFKSSPNKIELP